MKQQTLLPVNGARRTGTLYERHDDDDEHGTQLSGKVITTADSPPRKMIQIRLWTPELWAWTQYAIDPDTHAVIALATARKESTAFARLQTNLEAQGYTI